MKQIEQRKPLKLKEKSHRIDTVITQENIEGCIFISCIELHEAGICHWLETKGYSADKFWRCKGKNKQPISIYEPNDKRPKWCPLLKLNRKAK